MVETLTDKQTTFEIKPRLLTPGVVLLPTQKASFTLAAEEQGGELVFYHQVLPGPASRSYGIEVAQLAGMPQQVVNRAKEVLASLQSPREDT